MKKPKLNEMTLREKIGQTAAVLQDLLFEKLGTMEEIKKYLKDNPYGSLWTGHAAIERAMARFSDDNNNSVSYYSRQNKELNELSNIPLLIGCDGEWGAKMFFKELSLTQHAAGLGATQNPDYVYQTGKCIASEMATTGVNWIWDPVCDFPYYHSPIHNRAYTDDVELAKKMVAAKVRGLQDHGVAATMKHFPGTGEDTRDPHCAQSVDHSSYERWLSREGAVFQAAIDAGVMSCMVGHTAWTGLDNKKLKSGFVPATLSYKIITEILKGQMGFEGVVITDGIGMRALRLAYDLHTLYVELLKAGNDVILGPLSLDYIDVVEKAVLNGELSMERIDDACGRVLDMKEKLGMFSDDYTGEVPSLTPELLENTRRMNVEVAEKSVTLICNKEKLIPIKRDNVKSVGIIYIGADENTYHALTTMQKAFEERGAKVTITRFLDPRDEHDEYWSGEYADKHYDLIIYVPHVPFDGNYYLVGEAFRTTVFTLCYGAEKSIVVAAGSPCAYFDYFLAADTYIDAYHLTDEVQEAVVAGIYGEIEFTGKTPCKIVPEGRECEL